MNLFGCPEENKTALASMNAGAFNAQKFFENLLATLAWAKEHVPSIVDGILALIETFKASHPNVVDPTEGK